MAGPYTPPAAFSFAVALEVDGAREGDGRFSEVSGLEAEIEVETIAEGGENRFLHKLPGRAKYPNLVLKRGLLVESGLTRWVRDALETTTIVPASVWVMLLDAEAKPLVTWNFVSCWPVKWSLAGFNAQENALAVETLELAYERLTRS